MAPFGVEPWGDVFSDRLWPEWRRDMGEEWTPTMDFSEKDGAYHITAELPGLKKEDISITFENGYVTISGKKEAEKEEAGADYYVKESRYGSFSRSFLLPGKVDEEKVKATYKKGVLNVVLPHNKGSDVKKIEVH
jgi:HSP20 family protein